MQPFGRAESRQRLTNSKTASIGAANCDFCIRAGVNSRPWYDWHVLYRDEHVTIVPALGALIPGYLLMLPTHHRPSFAVASAAEYAAASAMVERIRAIYKGLGYDHHTVFEHGCFSDTAEAPGCVTHAHWHVVPLNLDLTPSTLTWTEVAGFAALRDGARRFPQGQYLYVQNLFGTFVSRKIPARQYLRQLLASQIGRTEEWDYVAFPFLEHVSETISMPLTSSYKLPAQPMASDKPRLTTYRASPSGVPQPLTMPSTAPILAGRLTQV